MKEMLTYTIPSWKSEVVHWQRVSNPLPLFSQDHAWLIKRESQLESLAQNCSWSQLLECSAWWVFGLPRSGWRRGWDAATASSGSSSQLARHRQEWARQVTSLLAEQLLPVSAFGSPAAAASVGEASLSRAGHRGPLGRLRFIANESAQ